MPQGHNTPSLYEMLSGNPASQQSPQRHSGDSFLATKAWFHIKFRRMASSFDEMPFLYVN